jgi:hypothetical protein
VLNLELDRTLLLNRSLIILSRRRARSLPGSDESAAASVPQTDSSWATVTVPWRLFIVLGSGLDRLLRDARVRCPST